MITRILRKTLAEMQEWEQQNPEDAQSLAPSLRALRFHIACVLQYIEQPTAEDLGNDPDEIDRQPIVKTG